eukprot:gene32584-biopygen21034
MNRWPFAEWFGASVDASVPSAQASTVMAMRAVRSAMGGSAALDEFQLMFTEKMAASLELHAAAMSGGLGTAPARATRKAIGFYRGKVRANRRRLARK